MWLAHIHDMVRVYRGITKKQKLLGTTQWPIYAKWRPWQSLSVRSI